METGIITEIVNYIKNLIQQIVDFFRNFNDQH